MIVHQIIFKFGLLISEKDAYYFNFFVEAAWQLDTLGCYNTFLSIFCQVPNQCQQSALIMIGMEILKQCLIQCDFLLALSKCMVAIVSVQVSQLQAIWSTS